MSRSWLRLLAALGLAALAASLLVSVNSAPAQAAARDGKCDSGEFCYYYNSDYQGSISDHGASLADYGSSQPECYEFKGTGAGKGQCIKNNAASVWNRTSKTIRVYFNSNYGGSYVDIASGARKNLRGTCCYNNNASHRPKPTTTNPGGLTPISTGVYKEAATLTAGFDGYRTTPGRHEGIDIADGVGSPVYALVAGTVINVSEGARGSSGLSTIAVYNASLNKTIIYLHSDPQIARGATISKGQRIAVEDWRGVSSTGAAHTHVEMRPGRQAYAAESVCSGSEIGNPNDSCNILENPNPRTFWQGRGFDSTR